MKISVNDKFVDISHLKDIVRIMTLDLPQGNTKKKNARLEFRFSCHCYSRRPKDGEDIPQKMLVKDGSTTTPRDRVFCWTRYNLSLMLVQHIDVLLAENRNVEESRNLNFFASYLIVVDEDGVSKTVPYYVFMRAKKKQDINQPEKLDIFIESAYPSDPDVPPPVARKKPIPISEVLGFVWANKR